jgi:nucleolar MIF4G domain-containing protein 1
MLVSIFQTIERRPKSHDNDDKLLVEIVAKAKDAPQMLPGLQYFLENVVSSSSLAKSSSDKKTLRHACRTAVDTLAVLSSSAL